MSTDSKEKNLNAKETENNVSESNVNKSQKKFKSNYCYLCNVQCTAPKCFLDHEKGKKHLKNLSLLEAEKKNAKKKKINGTKKKVSSKNSLGGKNCSEKEHKIENSESVGVETMNYSNNYNQYNSPNSEDSCARYPNATNFYSNDYRNNRSYHNERRYQNYSRWNLPFSNTPRMPHTYNRNFGFNQSHQYQYFNPEYNESNENGFFSERHNFHNSQGSFDTSSPYSHKYNDPVKENECSSNSAEFEFPGKRTFGSIFSPSKDIGQSNSKIYYSDETSFSFETSNEKQNDNTDIKNSKQSVENTDDNATASKQLLKCLISKYGEKQRLRSRSLSLPENEKKGKDKNENQVDPEASKEQQIKDWANSLLETNHNQISRLINPSNYKEKAAVNHLITKFSKSKRKEILTKTLRSNSIESIENNDDDAAAEEGSIPAVESSDVASEDISILDSQNQSSDLEQNVKNSPVVHKRKKSYSKNNDSDDLIIKSSFDDIFKSVADPSFIKSSKNSERDKDCSSPKQVAKKKKEDAFQEKYVKRKKSIDSPKVRKRQRSVSNESFEQVSSSKVTELQDTNEILPSHENLFNVPGTSKTSDQVSSDAVPKLKEEIIEEHLDVNESASSIPENSKNTVEPNAAFNSDFTVESLIQLFASGNVKLKEEFNDPVMDALKEISSDELINACSTEFPKIDDNDNVTADLENRRNSKDISASDTSINSTQRNKNCISPVIMGSGIFHENIIPVSVANMSTSSLPNSSTSDKTADLSQFPSSVDVDKNSDNSISDLNKLNLLNQTKLELPPQLNKLIIQLQEIASEEETVQQNLTEAKSKINEYTFLLEEWKIKKRKLQEQEEDLRKKRNKIIKSMQSAVKSDDDDCIEKPNLLPKESLSNIPSTSNKKQRIVQSFEITDNSKKPPATSSPKSYSVKRSELKKKESRRSQELEEITVLPQPSKQQPVEIIICDDEEITSAAAGGQSNLKDSRNSVVSNPSSKKRPIFYDIKDMKAHATVINCLVVFEDFLYTCSNDNTAKRFNLKDSSLTVTYLHTSKNVTEIVVEKVQNEALVLTSCSTRILSLFIASSGTKIKSFYLTCAVMSICKGWGKFYSGLANGAVNVYNWKYEETEIVKTENPVSRIATGHQGRLHVLVILSSEGNISIRDAETALLIRYIKIPIKHPSWMCLHSDLVYLSSADKILIIVDIVSGKVEKKLHLNNHTTGLAVYDDYIFTISYSGIINCYNKDNSCDKKIYYGAGKIGLTCVHVYHDWVFTGNRKGDISLFKFSPFSTALCEFAKCDSIYGLKEDLEYHIEKDHLPKKKTFLKCSWRGCDFTFPRNADLDDKMNHLRTHVYEMNVTMGV